MMQIYPNSDHRNTEAAAFGATKTLFVHKDLPQTATGQANLCDDVDMVETTAPSIPYNEEEAKMSMGDAFVAARMIRNIKSNDEDWEERIHKFTWTAVQAKIFDKVARILDMDQVARLAIVDRQHEAVHRRAIVDKSVARFRKVMASISWDTKLTQWLHALLQENLPLSYLAIYMDILQTLKSKVPSLTDRILFGRPGNINQDFVGYTLKKPWEPQVAYRNRKLPGSPFIVVAPSVPCMTQKTSTRMQQWYTLLTTMAAVIPIQVPMSGAMRNQPLQTITEQMVFVTRSKIQEIRQEAPDRPIILLGFNAGAALALQVGMVESVNCIVSLGFAYNTLAGPRGAPDDHILDINAPVLFVIGQDGAKSSPEEIEGLREKMQTQTALVVVGSADDALRVGKTKRNIEGVTQSMVDNLIIDEVAAFCTKCLEQPARVKVMPMAPLSMQQNMKKRKSESEHLDKLPKKIGRPPGKANAPMKIPKETMKDRKLISIKPPQPEEIVMKDEMRPETPKRRDDLGIKILETKKLSPIPVVKTEGGITQLEIKPSQALKQQLITSSVSFPGSGQKPQMIKLIPSNQFIQLKPNTVTTSTAQTTRIVTLKGTPTQIRTQPTVVKTTTIAPGSKIYTLKPNASGSQQLIPFDKPGPSQKPNFSPTKFTIMKQGASISTTSSGGASSDSSVTLSAESSPTTSDYSNILDMPVLFADNDGNIQHQQHHEDRPQQPQPPQHQQPVLQTRPTQYIIQTKPTVSMSGSSQMVQTVTSMAGKSIVIGNVIKTSTANNKPTNVVVLNKNTMRPILTKTSTGQTQLRYAKFVVAPQNAQKLIQTQMIPTSSTTTTTMMTAEQQQKFITTTGKRIEFVNSSMIRTTPTMQGGSGEQQQKYTPFIINVDPTKSQQFKTFKPTTSTGQILHIGPKQIPVVQTSMPQNFMIKPSILKQVSVTTKPAPQKLQQQPQQPTLVSRGNLTVKRVITLPPKTDHN